MPGAYESRVGPRDLESSDYGKPWQAGEPELRSQRISFLLSILPPLLSLPSPSLSSSFFPSLNVLKLETVAGQLLRQEGVEGDAQASHQIPERPGGATGAPRTRPGPDSWTHS